MGDITVPKDHIELPKIHLDTTLAELYKRASPKNAGKRIVQVLCGTTSGLDLNLNFPRNAKYLYLDSPFNNVPMDELREGNEQLQRSLSVKYLSLIPQRDAFICGDTNVVFFNLSDADEEGYDRSEVEKTIKLLDQSQRPHLVFCSGPNDIPDIDPEKDLVAYKLAVDGLEAYPLTIDLETHWFLNTKGALATSGLPTPDAKIVEITGYSPPPETCCIECQGSEAIYIQSSCTGDRGRWVKEQIPRILAEIERHSLPFVVKNQQSFGGAGTYVVETEKEKQKLLKDFEEENLPKLLSQVTVDNHHLNPATIIISDMVKDPIGDYGLTFFATEEGEPIFLAISEQMIDDDNCWTGSIINYNKQDQHKTKFEPIMRQISDWIRSYGYYGPVGADILETASNKDDGLNLHIVDLNVRTSGSLCLPLLRGHFTSRGLHCASSFSIALKDDRDTFRHKWKEQFESGQICILSWYGDSRSGQSLADIAVGAENEKELKEWIDRVQDSTDKVIF